MSMELLPVRLFTILEIKSKILERSGYDEVFYGDDGGEASDYNQIKDAVQTRMNYQ